MARGNKTRYALLGLLSIAPMSGYDVKKFTDFSLGYFWNENYGHIYPILRKLRNEGLVAGRTERTRGKPDRNVYRLTKKGETALGRWLDLPAERQPVRNEFLLKLFFGQRVPKESLAGRLREERGRSAAYLAELEALETTVSEDFRGKEGLPFWLMTLHFGKSFAKMTRDWCDECLRELQSTIEEENT